MITLDEWMQSPLVQFNRELYDERCEDKDDEFLVFVFELAYRALALLDEVDRISKRADDLCSMYSWGMLSDALNDGEYVLDDMNEDFWYRAYMWIDGEDKPRYAEEI